MDSLLACRLWLFDLDDTLVDWVGRFQLARRRVAEEAARRFDMPDAGAWSRLFAQGHATAWPRWEAGEISRETYRRERFRLALETLGLSDDPWLDDISVRFVEMCRSYVTPDPRVQQLLTHLGQSHLLAVLTNGFSHAQRDVLSRAGLLSFFPHIFTAEETGYTRSPIRWPSRTSSRRWACRPPIRSSSAIRGIWTWPPRVPWAFAPSGSTRTASPHPMAVAPTGSCST